VMGIERIGSQGQPFSAASLGKARALRAMYPSVPIEFDGGVGLTTISAILASGVSRIVVGSALSDAADPALIFEAMQQAAVDNLSAEDRI
jgi:pentose-5-phosphate-3-epimerase